MTDERALIGYDPQRLLTRQRERNMVHVPVALTERSFARLHIPRDMTRTEAAKLARVVEAYGAL